MLKLIAKILFASVLASSYSYVGYAQDEGSDDMMEEVGEEANSDLDATPGTETKMAAPIEKPARVEKPAPIAKAKAKKTAKNKKMATKKH